MSGRSAIIFAWVAGLTLGIALRAQPAPPHTSGPILSAGEIWTVPEPLRKTSFPVKMEFTANYYDAAWHLLWGEDGGGCFFLPITANPLAIRSGQRVRVEGTVVPADGLDGPQLKITVLQRDAWAEPRPTAGRVDDVAALDPRWVVVTGYVVGQQEVDSTHFLITVLSDGRLINARVQVGANDPVPQLIGARVQLYGVYIANRDPAGALHDINLWVPRRQDVRLLTWLSDDARFLLPRTALASLAESAAAPWIRAIGEVKATEPGKSITLRDDTGQITVATAQLGDFPAGAKVEVVGHPVSTNAGWVLGDPIFRRKEDGAGEKALASTTDVLSRLRLAQQVLALPSADAERGFPVTLRGVVTWVDRRADIFYLQDSSGGVRVRCFNVASPPPIGASVSMTGLTVSGSFAPEVQMRDFHAVSPLPPPPAHPLSLEQALTGAYESQWVEMRSYVHAVEDEGDWTRLDLTAETGEFSAYAPAEKSLHALVGAVVRLTGVCMAEVNGNRELTGIRLWVPSRDSVSVDDTPAADPFGSAVRFIASLRQFRGSGEAGRRVHVAGCVQMTGSKHYFHLQDASGGILVLTRDPRPLAVGDWVEVVGFPGRSGSRPVLREAVWRSMPAGEPIDAATITNTAIISTELDTRLVRVEATLRQVGLEPDRTKLALNADGINFDAVLDGGHPDPVPPPGSRLRVTGIYLVEYDEDHQPRGFRLQLRSPDDVAVLAPPLWWTPGRVMLVAAGFACCTVLGFVWVTLLRRRVRRQTEQIRLQMEKEARMQSELERSSRLDSLGVLAGGIAHDFNNLLTAIMGNIGLLRLDPGVMSSASEQVLAAERAAKRAGDVTQQLLTFAKGGDPVRSIVDLPELVREAAGFARHGSSVRVEFNFPADLPPADVDSSQISRVVHNLVLNSVQAMATGGVVQISLAAFHLAAGEVPPLMAGRYLRLTIADNGPGIPAARLSRIFDPYFSTKAKGSGLGLATAHSIVKKHQGTIAVDSTLGRGTTFHIWLPAAVRPATATRVPTADPGFGVHARILFMDDEEVLRNLVQSFLARSGHEGTLVADGAAAVAAYAEARAQGRGYQVVILDLTVPGGMGGRDAVAELRRIDPEVCAVASSGYSNDPVMANHRAYGFAAVMPKPYDFETFNRVIGRLQLSRKSASIAPAV